MVRLWGVFLPWGRNNVPVGMTVAFRERDNGCAVDVHTYDQLGWYLDARTNLTFKEESEAKMEVLLGEIREAFDQGPEEAPSVRKISGSSNNSPQSHAGTEAFSQDPANRTNPLSVASFFLSFFICLLGIVMGHIALKQIKRTGEGGRGLAIAGLVIGYTILVLGLIVLISLVAGGI
jgi:hypothetical protein